MNLLSKFNVFKYHTDILLLIALCPLYNAFVGSYGVFQLLTVPLLLLFLFYKHTDKKTIRTKRYVKVFIIILIQAFLLSLVFDKSAVQMTKALIIALLVMIHPLCMKTSKIIYPFMSVVGIIVGIVMLRDQVFVSGVRLSLMIGDVLQDPNWLAIFFFAPFCYGMKLLQIKKTQTRLLAIVLIMFSVYIVFLTGSRGAMLGMITAFIFWIRFTIRQTTVINMLFLSASLLLFTFVFISYFMPNVEIGLLIRYTGEDTDSQVIRREIWSGLIDEYFNGNFLEMLFGRGPGACVDILGRSAHNILLEQLFQMGFIGFALLLYFIVGLFWDTIQCDNFVGLYLLVSLFVLSLTTPIWGHIYFMIPLSMVVYVNNTISYQKRNSIIYMKR